MKTCRRCMTALPYARFHGSTRSSDGLQAMCKDCGNESRRLRIAGQRAAVIAAVVRDDHSKHCRRCDTTKPKEDFHRNVGTSDGLQCYCKPCSREATKRSQQQNAQATEARKAERAARPAVSTGTKVCNKCHAEKPVLDFYLHRSTKDGRSTYCAECQKATTRAWTRDNADRVRARNAAARAADPEGKRRDHRQFWLKMYGLSQADYERMMSDQGGVCAICQRPERVVDVRTGEPRRLSVDHCHETHVVRGLLCGHCNRGIGQFEDDPALLGRAASYLKGLLTTR